MMEPIIHVRWGTTYLWYSENTYLIIFLRSGSHHVGICGPLGVICVFKLHDHTSYQKKNTQPPWIVILFLFLFLFWYNRIVILYYAQIFKKTHTQILKKHITKMNLFLQTNKLLTDVFISSKSVYYKAQ